MALIQCNECGSMVSEKSDVCMKCGNPVSEIMKEINEKKKRKKKKLLTIGCVFAGVIVICIVAAFLFLHFGAGKNEFYADVEWGSSYDEGVTKLKKFYKDDELRESHEKDSLFVSVENYMGDKGIKASLSYGYVNEKFTGVTILVSISDDSTLTAKQLSEKYEKMFVKKFGEKYEEQDDGFIKEWTLSDSTATLYANDKFVAMSFKTEKE